MIHGFFHISDILMSMLIKTKTSSEFRIWLVSTTIYIQVDPKNKHPFIWCKTMSNI